MINCENGCEFNQGTCMKNLKKLSIFILPVILSTILTSCAAGAATAGYALKAQSADSLTAEAEQRIIKRAKYEVLTEIQSQRYCDNFSTTSNN